MASSMIEEKLVNLVHQRKYISPIDIAVGFLDIAKDFTDISSFPLTSYISFFTRLCVNNLKKEPNEHIFQMFVHYINRYSATSIQFD